MLNNVLDATRGTQELHVHESHIVSWCNVLPELQLKSRTLLHGIDGG